MFYHIPSIVQKLLPQILWTQVYGQRIYLTFDDGPIPEATPFVLDQLAAYNAKATFFCVGENVKKYPKIYQRIIDEGHTVGNHTYNHLNGWFTKSEEYIANAEKAAALIESRLFRPPYGKLKPKQYRALKEQYKIVMWDVLSMDYDSKISAEKCKQIVLQNSQLGSVIVFHDSVKSIEKLKTVLPQVLTYFNEKNWKMDSLKDLDQQVNISKPK